jgi:DNA-binding GntR family transcriptional regulator
MPYTLTANGAAREAAARLGPEEAAGLQTTLVSMDEALRRSAYEEWSELNSRFHVAISAITGMPLLREMTERVLGQWDRVRRHNRGALVDYAAFIRQHQEA